MLTIEEDALGVISFIEKSGLKFSFLESFTVSLLFKEVTITDSSVILLLNNSGLRSKIKTSDEIVMNLSTS